LLIIPLIGAIRKNETVVGEERVKDFSFSSRHGVIGDPTIATKDQGKELTNKIVNRIIRWIDEMQQSAGIYRNW